MNNLFDINSLSDNVTVKVVNNTKIYIKDNFYKNPQEVVDFILSQPCNKWKSWESPSYNGTHFLDQRHDFYDERMIPVSAEIEKRNIYRYFCLSLDQNRTDMYVAFIHQTDT